MTSTPKLQAFQAGFLFRKLKFHNINSTYGQLVIKKKSFVNRNLFANYILEVDLSSREVVKQGVERQGAACNRT